MSFSNRIRLPFKLHKPQFLEDANRYRKANGVTVTLSVVVRKVYEGLTDSIPEKLHERLKIALVHDSVQVEGDKYVGVITQEGDYQIEWQDFLSHPLAQGKFKAEVSPFNATNSNCGTCQEMIQVVANDDDAGTLNENTDYTIDVLANDEICCNPITISLVTFDSNYLASAVINANNEIVVHTQTTMPALTHAKILTYRAQCANGQFDEADVYADLNGTIPACQMVTGLNITNLDTTSVTVNWTPAAGATSYIWQLRTLPDNTIVGGATISPSDHADITGLIPGQEYIFYILTNCGTGNESPSASITFTTTTPPPADTCGDYELFNTDPDNFRAGSYTDCDGIERSINIGPLHQREICVLQFSGSNPVNLVVESQITVTYLGTCF